MLVAVVAVIEKVVGLEPLVAAVGGDVADSIAQGGLGVFGQRLKVQGDGDVLVKLVHRSGSAAEGGDGLGESVAAALGGGEIGLGDELAEAAEGLHADAGHAALECQGKDLSGEAAEHAVEDADGHLAGVPFDVALDHVQKNGRMLVAGEADVAGLALALGVEDGVDSTVGAEYQVGVVVVVALVELEQVDVIGLETVEAFVDLLGGGDGVAGTDFGGEEDLVAAAFESAADVGFADAVAVVPGGVDEGDTAIDSGLNGADGDLLVDARTGQVTAAKGDDGDAVGMAAKLANGDGVGGVDGHVTTLVFFVLIPVLSFLHRYYSDL